ncbi:hypothetical protein FACS189444_0150 [Spirochaetia bacterium]|nr:hypothetical protein FACS189444_0150 [Spirochaetia bacterium]
MVYNTDLTNIAYSENYINYRDRVINLVFSERNKTDENELINDGLKIISNIYNTVSDDKNYFCNNVKVFINDKLIHNYFNLYTQLFFCKNIKYKNGKNYLFYKEDLYGYSVLDIETNIVFNYYPKATFENNIETFIGTDIHYNNGNLFAVGGCIWACPYDTLIIKINNPMEMFSEFISIHQMLDKGYKKYEDIDFIEWEVSNIKLKFENTELYKPQNEIIILKEEEYKDKLVKINNGVRTNGV